MQLLLCNLSEHQACLSHDWLMQPKPKWSINNFQISFYLPAKLMKMALGECKILLLPWSVKPADLLRLEGLVAEWLGRLEFSHVPSQVQRWHGDTHKSGGMQHNRKNPSASTCVWWKMQSRSSRGFEIQAHLQGKRPCKSPNRDSGGWRGCADNTKSAQKGTARGFSGLNHQTLAFGKTTWTLS